MSQKALSTLRGLRPALVGLCCGLALYGAWSAAPVGGARTLTVADRQLGMLVAYSLQEHARR